jgi:hypothetical protein
MLVTGGSTKVEISDSTLWKQGATSIAPWFNDEGFNANINVVSEFAQLQGTKTNLRVTKRNGSIASFQDCSLTTNNGAMNIFARDQGTTVSLEDCWIYSSGFGAWGVQSLYGAAVNVKSTTHCSGGFNSPGFAGGNLVIIYSNSHTSGIGSPNFYAFGPMTISHSTGSAENSPAVIIAGPQTVYLDHAFLSAKAIAVIACFNYLARPTAAATVNVNYGSIHVSNTTAVVWAGNSIVKMSVDSVSIQPISGSLIVTEWATLKDDLTQIIKYGDPSISPGQVYFTASDSFLRGYATIGASSYVKLILTNHTSWMGGTVFRDPASGAMDVYIDGSSAWYPYANSTVRKLSIAKNNVTRIGCTGFNASYHSLDTDNAWLGGVPVKIPNCPAGSETWLVPRAEQGPIA